MSAHPLRRGAHLVLPVLVVAAVLAILGGAATAANRPAPLKLAGIWSGSYSGAFSGTFSLHWTQTGSKLTGTITLSNPHGKYGISGSISRGTVKFGAVSVGATYSGTASATSMSGRWKSPRGGGTWSAHKLKTRTT